VIHSTHIVEDVTDLCPRMAMICQGNLLLSGKPSDAIEALHARVWRARIRKAELADYQARYTVLQSRLVGGEPVIHVFSETQPEGGFQLVEPDLEDVYFLKLRQHRAAA